MTEAPTSFDDPEANERWLQEQLAKAAFELLYPGLPYPDLVSVEVADPSEQNKKSRKLNVNLFISPPSSLDKDKLQ